MANPNIKSSAKAVGIPSPLVIDWMRAKVVEGGGDPESVPDLSYRFLRPAEVMTICGISLRTVYRLIEDGTFRKVPLDRARRVAA